ncbi:hypothetical protein [Marinilabilia sp.]|uniref:hypothetical protein n=1 Tax=Marinilabilia sp. TaxID=2021252 RepID=UPI0025C49383|nr:hypothetical protein [Marinilabilia sp.]
MKKLYTILTALLMVGLVNAQDWNISDSEFNSLGSIEAETTINGLTIYANAAKPVVIDGNNKTVDGISYSYRMKLGGSGDFTDATTPAARVLKFNVNGPKEISIVLQSSSSSSDRLLNVAMNSEDNVIGQLNALGLEATKQNISYTGTGAATIYLFSPSSGVNLYHIIVGEATSIATPAAGNANVVKTEYFSITGVNAGNNWNSLSAGVYIARITLDNGQVTTEKVTKVRR